ncbi:hypothetical protein ARSEF4850_003038 [Beauveria asiatica]
MTTLTPDYTPRSNTSKALLDQCGDVNAEIDGIEPSLEQLRILQHRALNDADNSSSSATNQQLDALSSETLVLYRELIKRVCTIKSNPEANDPKYKLSAGEIQCIMVHSGKKHVTCFVILALDELRESLLQNACSPCKEQSCRDAPGGALLLANLCTEHLDQKKY